MLNSHQSSGSYSMPHIGEIFYKAGHPQAWTPYATVVHNDSLASSSIFRDPKQAASN